MHFLLFQFIEKFHEVKEATRTATKPTNGTTPTTSASASPVAARSAANVGPGAIVTAPDGNQVKMQYIYYKIFLHMVQQGVGAAVHYGLL